MKEILAVLILAALVFGVCFLIDKGFTRLFRNQAQHHSGTAIRLNKRYGSIGILVGVLGIAALFSGLSQGGILIAGGCLLLIVGIGLTVYYMTFGVFYDEESFIYTRFGRRSVVYRYQDITGQLLYNNAGNILIELHMADGGTVPLQTTMTGVYDFMDTAFAGWLRQTGRNREDCSFYKPENSCWFPTVEG